MSRFRYFLNSSAFNARSMSLAVAIESATDKATGILRLLDLSAMEAGEKYKACRGVGGDVHYKAEREALQTYAELEAVVAELETLYKRAYAIACKQHLEKLAPFKHPPIKRPPSPPSPGQDPYSDLI